MFRMQDHVAVPLDVLLVVKALLKIKDMKLSGV